MSERILKVSYVNSEDAVDKIGKDNPEFLREIESDLDNALSSIRGISGVGSAVGLIEEVRDDLEFDRKRYANFAPCIARFYNDVEEADEALKDQYSTLFSKNVTDKNHFHQLVDNYYTDCMALDISQAAEGLKDENIAVSSDDLSTMARINSIEEQIKEKRKKGESTSELEKVLKEIWAEKFGSAAAAGLTIADTGKTVAEEYVALKYPKLSESAAQELQSKIGSITKQLSRLDLSYIKPGSKSENILETILGELKDEDGALKTAEKAIGYTKDLKCVGWALVAVQFGMDGYKDIVVDGRSWDAAAKDIAADGVGIGSSSAIGGIVGGGKGIVIATIFNFVYDKFLKKPVTNAINEFGDWWKECQW